MQFSNTSISFELVLIKCGVSRNADLVADADVDSEFLLGKVSFVFSCKILQSNYGISAFVVTFSSQRLQCYSKYYLQLTRKTFSLVSFR